MDYNYHFQEHINHSVPCDKQTWKNERKITTKCREILIRISRCLDWIVRVNAVGPSVHLSRMFELCMLI